MVEVSEKYMELAQESGRHVYCKIIAGNETFLDDRILEFDFDDVCHPDWYTIGTTCSNRFSFSVKYAGELEVNDVVMPYVSFDNEEWCPLGIFYVARRYVRGNYASIICYDKFYSLDVEYFPSVQLPTTTDVILKDVCSMAGITCEKFGHAYSVEKIPEGCTLRDMIGYIAAMNRSVAKLDRSGALVMKAYTQMNFFFLYEKNCMDFSRNMSYSRITALKVDTGDEILEGGSGGELATLELYNPFMTQKRVDDMIMEFAPFRFYGADIVMQGMPFLESGDYIFFYENDRMFYPIAIGEIEYHYDGALTATLHSKNKSYTDAAVHQNDLDAALEEIRAQLGNIYLKQTNEQALSLNTEPLTVADFEFNTKVKNTFAQIDANFTIDASSGRTLNIDLYVNGEKVSRTAVHISSGSREMLHFYYLADKLPKGKNHIEVKFSLASGTALIAKQQLIATLVGKGMAGGNSDINDRASFFEKLGTYNIKAGAQIVLAGISEQLQSN